MKNPAVILTADFSQWFKIEIFRRVLYIFLLLNAITLLPIAYEAYGYYGISGSRGWNFNIPTIEQGSYAFLNVLSHPVNAKLPWLYLIFVWGQILFLITGILRIAPRISSIMVWFFTTNLFLKGSLMFTGGEVLSSFLLFYLMFIQRSDYKFSISTSFRISKDEKPEFHFFQNLLNNTFYRIILIQICIVYFFSTLYKLMDADWLSGHAVMYVSRVEEYSSGVMKFLFSENYFLSAVATYSILAYQALFPVLVWFKKIKIPFLIFGLVLHLGISFGMGIFMFGIMMCLVYILFLEENQIEKLGQKLKLLKG